MGERVKTVIKIEDVIKRRANAHACLNGVSLSDYIETALRVQLTEDDIKQSSKTVVEVD